MNPGSPEGILAVYGGMPVRTEKLPAWPSFAQAQGATYRGRQVGLLETLPPSRSARTKSPARWVKAECSPPILLNLGESIGISRSWHWAGKLTGNGFRWIHDAIGTNWRMTEAQATVGRKQLKKTNWWLDRRRELAKILYSRLGKIPALRIVPACSTSSPPTTAFTPSFVRKNYDPAGTGTQFSTL